VLVNTETFLEPDLQYSANLVWMLQRTGGISASDKDICAELLTESNICWRAAAQPVRLQL
jgi:hypothetical protein